MSGGSVMTGSRSEEYVSIVETSTLPSGELSSSTQIDARYGLFTRVAPSNGATPRGSASLTSTVPNSTASQRTWDGVSAIAASAVASQSSTVLQSCQPFAASVVPSSRVGRSDVWTQVAIASGDDTESNTES